MREHDDAAVLRGDAWRNLQAIAFTLARRASWRHMTTRPAWDEIADIAGVSRRTVARWVAWLRHRQLLGVVEPGSTERYRPGDDGAGNRAAEYLLTVPLEEPADKTVTPTPTPEGGGCSRSPHAREADSELGRDELDSDTLRPGTKAAARAEERAQAAQVAVSVPCLRRLSTAYVAWLIRPYVTAGWAPSDVVHALNHHPDGRLWPYTQSPKHPAGWFRHRLRPWLDERAQPGLSRSQQLVADAKRTRAEQTRRQQETLKAAARTIDPERKHAIAAAQRAKLLDQLKRRKHKATTSTDTPTGSTAA